jgi:hypothetical protein
METHRFSVKDFPYISASTSMAELIKKDSVASLLTQQSYRPFKGLDKPPYFLVLTPGDDLGRKLAECIYYDKGENGKCSDKYPDKNFYALFKLRRPSNFDDAVKVLTYRDIEDIINEVEKEEKSSSGREVFPIVIIPKDSKLNPFSPYYRIKAKLLSRRLVSQIVNVETISNPNTLRNSLLSIYVQLFVKAGGVPYLVYESSSILSDANEYNIIIGYSLSRDPIRHKNAVGSIIVYNPAGQWLASEFVLDELPFNNKDKLDYYKQSLEEALMSAYKVAVNKDVIKSVQKVNVIVHYRGKELSTKEEQVILETINKFREVNSSVYVLKIQQSDIVLSVTSKDYPDPDMYPPTGYYTKLLPDTFILQTVGKHIELGAQKDGKLKGNIKSGGTAKPVLVSIKRFGDNENSKLDSARRGQLSIGLLSSVFALARINYVSVYKHLISEPVTTRYARELAYIISRLSSMEVDGETDLKVLRDEPLRHRMWFI